MLLILPRFNEADAFSNSRHYKGFKCFIEPGVNKKIYYRLIIGVYISKGDYIIIFHSDLAFINAVVCEKKKIRYIIYLFIPL